MESRAARVLDIFRAAGKTLAVCETTTGGKISARLVEVPGASSFLKSSIVAYDKYSKTEVLKVPSEILETHGSVSAETALALAEATKRLFNSDYALAETGIAGSVKAGRSSKPAGMSYIAISGPSEQTCEQFQFSGERLEIQESIVEASLEQLLKLELR
mmetsp:Transcript_16570/g.29834  ORF Transcript_16570/g.29834 Transcript_16570/m.29834 type:complete len:159 (+) Transcript_16570:90-566(+)